MTPRETGEHIEAYEWREERSRELADWQTARLCSIIANVNRDKKKKPRPYSPKDFMPKKRNRVQTPEEQARVLKTMVIALGGEFRSA